jgi:ferrous iron transport protein B
MKIGLVGNPNVGKSLIFQQLTGIGVEISNYPGTTIGIQSGNTCFKHKIVEITDLPGIYSLDGDSEEEKTVRSFILSSQADALVAVLDASHIERNLYLLLQLAEYRLPLVVVLNMMDEAEKSGISIDIQRLSAMIGADVLPTTAIQGKNTDRIIPAVLTSAKIPSVQVFYDQHIEAAIKSLIEVYQVTRADAIQALIGRGKDQEIRDAVGVLSAELEKIHYMTVAQIIAGNRHHCAEHITSEVVTERTFQTEPDLDRLLTTRIPGIPILASILILVLMTVFFIGSWLEEQIVSVINILILEPFLQAGLPPLAEQLGLSIILAVQAGLGIALPFIFTFYLFISVLEDSGYLTRAAFLADRALHRFGMHGQGIIPIVLGFGCNVPAIMNIRLLRTKRERTIASFLVSLVPCSARTVIIAGLVAAFVGIGAALSVYLIIFGVVLLTGLVLSRYMPGEQYGMILEMSPLRMPRVRNVLAKSWMRIREFLVLAMPLLIAASIVLGLLQYAGIIDLFMELIEPFSETVLGLPSYAVTALIFGILRKEMALETLVVLAGTADIGSVMSMAQIYIFAVVSVLFIPCISTIAVLYREIGAKMALVISLFTFCSGILIGALLNLLLG